ncbi:MAG TPA: tetratricopeptide repeat protein [Burkholderiales bacterium]|nr:tetratricopeptide repeat protein [Burkholderiales bacterium]
MNFEYWRHYLRGRLFEVLRQTDAAAEEYRLASRLEPRNARLRNSLGFLMAQKQRWGEAVEYFSEALKLEPTDATAWFNLGFAQDKRCEPEKAIAAFSEAVKLRPALDRAWYGMGMAYAHLGRHQEAVKALEEAATLQPMNAHAWYALGMAHHATHHPDTVKEVVKHLYRFDPVMTRQLIRDAGRTDLAHLVKDLAV